MSNKKSKEQNTLTPLTDTQREELKSLTSKEIENALVSGIKLKEQMIQHAGFSKPQSNTRYK